MAKKNEAPKLSQDEVLHLSSAYLAHVASAQHLAYRLAPYVDLTLLLGVASGELEVDVDDGVVPAKKTEDKPKKAKSSAVSTYAYHIGELVTYTKDDKSRRNAEIISVYAPSEDDYKSGATASYDLELVGGARIRGVAEHRLSLAKEEPKATAGPSLLSFNINVPNHSEQVTVFVKKCKDGGYESWSVFPDVSSGGDTPDEALRNIEEALEVFYQPVSAKKDKSKKTKKVGKKKGVGLFFAVRKVFLDNRSEHFNAQDVLEMFEHGGFTPQGATVKTINSVLIRLCQSEELLRVSRGRYKLNTKHQNLTNHLIVRCESPASLDCWQGFVVSATQGFTMKYLVIGAGNCPWPEAPSVTYEEITHCGLQGELRRFESTYPDLWATYVDTDEATTVEDVPGVLAVAVVLPVVTPTYTVRTVAGGVWLAEAPAARAMHEARLAAVRVNINNVSIRRDTDGKVIPLSRVAIPRLRWLCPWMRDVKQDCVLLREAFEAQEKGNAA